MTTERQMKHLWIFLIVWGVLGFIFLIFFSIKYSQYRHFSQEEKNNLKSTISEMVNYRQLKKEGKDFVESILPKLFKNWDINAYLNLIQKENFSKKELGILPFYMQRNKEIYGSLLQHSTSDGKINLKGRSIKDMVIYGEYKISAVFKKKAHKIDFTISVIKNTQKNKWFLESFHDL